MNEDELGGISGTTGTQVALAQAAAPVWREGDAVPLSVDLSGNLRARLGTGIGAGAPDTVWIAPPVLNQGSIGVGSPWNGFAFQLGGAPFVPNGGIGGAFANWGGGTKNLVQPAGGQYIFIELQPGAGAGNPTIFVFRPGGLGGLLQNIPFCDTGDTYVAGGIGLPPLAYQISATIRKAAGADATFATQWFGILNITDVTNLFARRACMVGLLGDGVTGFQFGSVNCPDASNNPVDPSGQTIVNANAVACGPANPGTNALDVTIKMVPPIPGVVATGQVACYLGTTRLALYTTTVNFPRSSVSSIDVSQVPYLGVQLGLAQFPNVDGITTDPPFLVRNLRMKITTDLSTGVGLSS